MTKTWFQSAVADEISRLMVDKAQALGAIVTQDSISFPSDLPIAEQHAKARELLDLANLFSRKN